MKHGEGISSLKPKEVEKLLPFLTYANVHVDFCIYDGIIELSVSIMVLLDGL